MAKKTSLKDIANAVGVSTALVSYVLNGREREARVNPNTAEKIRQVAKKMNYQPNQVAKSLKSGRSLAIGLIVADISNPFFGHLARTIEDESEKAGYTVIFASSDEKAAASEKVMNTLINRQIDGFIIAPAEGSEKQLNYLIDSNIPFVLIDRYFKDVESSYVVSDNYKATYDATQHLINSGFERIGYVRYKNKMQHTEDRFKGYVQALKDNSMKLTQSLICQISYAEEEDFCVQFKKLMAPKNKIDAVVFSTNTLSILGLKALMELKIKVPDDIAVFCFDESESYDLFYCPVSYVKQPLEQIGKRAVEILVEHLSSRNRNILYKEILPTELIIRQSSEKVDL